MTKQVKILLGKDICFDDDYYSKKLIQDSLSDWEEISDEDYWFLHSNMWRLFKDYQSNYDLVPVLLVKDEKSVVQRVTSIKEIIQQEKEKQAKEKAAAEAKKLEKAKQRLLKKNLSEKELFEELKKKFGEKSG